MLRVNLQGKIPSIEWDDLLLNERVQSLRSKASWFIFRSVLPFASHSRVTGGWLESNGKSRDAEEE